MSYLMAQDTLNGAEGKITITRNGQTVSLRPAPATSISAPTAPTCSPIWS